MVAGIPPGTKSDRCGTGLDVKESLGQFPLLYIQIKADLGNLVEIRAEGGNRQWTEERETDRVVDFRTLSLTCTK